MRPSDLGLPAKFSQFFPGQEETTYAILEAPTRFVIVEAPTGTGKTVVNYCAAKLLGGRFEYLVHTKALQDQLAPDLGPAGVYDIRGHSNYPCARRVGGSLPGEIITGRSDEIECMDKMSCDYRAECVAAYESDAISTNYAHHIALSRNDLLTDRLGHFDTLICDEGHLVNDAVCDLFGFEVSKAFLRSLPREIRAPKFTEMKGISIAEWKSWCDELIRGCKEKLSMIDETSREAKKLTSTIRDACRFISDADTYAKWIVDRNESRYETTYKFQPVWSKDYAPEVLYGNAAKVIITSATIQRTEADRIGIPEEDLTFISVPSTFPASARKVVFVSNMPPIRVDSRIADGMKNLLIARVDSILSNHESDKGIIQCTSYDWAKYIFSNSDFRSSRLLSHSAGEDRQRTIAKFKASKEPLVLVSPSVKEGADFPGEQCRFQIILKVPFQDMRMPINQARKEDPTYSNDYTARTIIQQVGRGTRFLGDDCVTYIIDAHWLWFRKAAWESFPAYFREAWSSAQINRR